MKNPKRIERALIAATRETLRWRMKTIRAVLYAPAVYSLCPECGPNVKVDQDGCCAGCGGAATGTWLDRMNHRRPAKKEDT